jgi:hypothetical protein
MNSRRRVNSNVMRFRLYQESSMVKRVILVGYLALRQSKETVAANTFVATWAKKFPLSSWSNNIMRYLQREITMERLLALATDNAKLTEAHAFIGVNLSLSGSRQAALVHLHWVEKNGDKAALGYSFAWTEQLRLEAAPTK